MQKIDVCFRVERTGQYKGQVTAVFPAVYKGNNLWMCYARNGQHSSCSRSWFIKTKRATDQEAASLMVELKAIYKHGTPAVELVVKKRATWKIDRN